MERGTILKFTITLLAYASLVCLSTPISFAQPSPPCVFYGYVTISGKPAANALNVTAMIAGTGLKWTTQTNNGTYGWPLEGSSLFMIPSDNPDTAGKDGGAQGDTIVFYVNGTSVSQTASFNSAGVERLDLSIPGNTMEQSKLSVNLDCPATYAGYEVKISGRLTHLDGDGISGASLLATYSVAGEQFWQDIASFQTTTNGNYIAEWTPATTGNYSIKVNWEGNENVEGTEATVNLAVTPLEEKYVFSVTSNSTISELNFNSTSKTLDFTLDGPPGTTGYTNVTIAKDLITDISGIKVYLDGNQIEYTTIANDASYLLHFTYQHSTHKAIVDLSQPTQPFIETPLGIATMLGAIAIIIATIYVGRNKLKRPQETKPTKSSSKSQKPGTGKPFKRASACILAFERGALT